MIASLEGTIHQILDDSLVINVGGVGFRVFVPKNVCKESELYKNRSLFTHLVVREDALTLFGFETIEERDLFVLLLGANGVGPRTGLAILSSMSVGLIRKAVIADEADLFTRVPGVGKKTAQSIVLQLQGKIKGEMPEMDHATRDIDTEVMDALTGLGYSVVEAQTAIQMIPKDAGKDLETRLRLALQYFS
ncbi:MAG: Holliday junction branch migration protein RuvA [Anaerolineaceae bacterium]